MEKSKKFIVIFLTPFAMLFLTVSKFPQVESFLKKEIGISIFTLDITIQVLTYAILTLATIYTYFITFYSPYNKYEKLASKRWATIDDRANKIRDNYVGYALNINVLIPKRSYFYTIEPKKNDPNKKRFSLTGKIFKAIWSIGEPANKGFKMTVNQGYSGQVFKEMRRPLFIDFTNSNARHINFTHEQVEKCSDILVLATVPIYKRIDGMDRQKIKYLGVLNMECTSDNAPSLLQNNQNLQKLRDDLVDLAQLCANLLE